MFRDVGTTQENWDTSLLVISTDSVAGSEGCRDCAHLLEELAAHTTVWTVNVIAEVVSGCLENLNMSSLDDSQVQISIVPIRESVRHLRATFPVRESVILRTEWHAHIDHGTVGGVRIRHFAWDVSRILSAVKHVSTRSRCDPRVCWTQNDFRCVSGNRKRWVVIVRHIPDEARLRAIHENAKLDVSRPTSIQMIPDAVEAGRDPPDVKFVGIDDIEDTTGVFLDPER